MRAFYKRIIRTLLLLLVFAAIAPFVYPLKNGKPLLSFEQLRLPSLPDIPLLTGGNTSESETVTAYKWRDSQGNWQFGSEPPQDVPYEAVELDPNTNLLQRVKSAPEPAPAKRAAMDKTPDAGEEDVVFGYTPEKIEAMMEKTREVRDAMDVHHQSLEGLDK